MGFDLVVFTGDLGDWGHPTDYPRALTFLKQTCAALDVPLTRLFVIPGNHDIDRNTQVAAWRWVEEALRVQRALVHVDNVDSMAAAELVAELNAAVARPATAMTPPAKPSRSKGKP